MRPFGKRHCDVQCLFFCPFCRFFSVLILQQSLFDSFSTSKFLPIFFLTTSFGPHVFSPDPLHFSVCENVNRFPFVNLPQLFFLHLPAAQWIFAQLAVDPSLDFQPFFGPKKF